MFQQVLHELYMDSDPRVKDWAFMSSFQPTLFIVVVYLIFVLRIGPAMMKGKNPLQMRKIIVLYNVLQVLYNCYIFSQILTHWIKHRYSLLCQPIDYGNSPEAIAIARLAWNFYICKLTELFDTISFVLLKKHDNCSRLHVVHHSTMIIIGWLTTKFIPGGQGTFHCMINSFIHIIMYTYYLLAALGPGYRKYLWWKKYLTTIQLVQFVIIISHALQVFFNSCNYPKSFAALAVGQSLYFFLEFQIFYKNTYSNTQKKMS